MCSTRPTSTLTVSTRQASGSSHQHNSCSLGAMVGQRSWCSFSALGRFPIQMIFCGADSVLHQASSHGWRRIIVRIQLSSLPMWIILTTSGSSNEYPHKMWLGNAAYMLGLGITLKNPTRSAAPVSITLGAETLRFHDSVSFLLGNRLKILADYARRFLGVNGDAAKGSPRLGVALSGVFLFAEGLWILSAFSGLSRFASLVFFSLGGLVLLISTRRTISVGSANFV